MNRILILILIGFILFPVFKGTVSFAPLVDLSKDFSTVTLQKVWDAVSELFTGILRYYTDFIMSWFRAHILPRIWDVIDQTVRDKFNVSKPQRTP